MPDPTLFVELVAPICLSLSLSLPSMSAWFSSLSFFLIFFSHIKECVMRGDERTRDVRRQKYLSSIPDTTSVILICLEFLS